MRLRPGAGSDQLLGFEQGVLRARVKAPPLEGRANKALCRLIAKRAGVAPSRVSVVRGGKARLKRVRIEGGDPAAIRAALGG
ncbi:MAG: DUF167 domain-containing protein [Solirubrobacterales bacterium]